MARIDMQKYAKKDTGKCKLGTTVLVKTDKSLSMFKELHSDEFKTPGEVIDALAEVGLRVNAGAASELLEFCAGKITEIEQEISGIAGGAASEMRVSDLKDRADYYGRLGRHLSRFLSRDDDARGRATMKRIGMRNGAYLVIPDDWPVINEDDAADCDYASVLEVSNWDKYDVPHFVYFSNDEACSHKEMADAVAGVWPQIRDIQIKQIEPAYNKDGVVLNAEEWKKAPIIGVFPIRDSTSFSWGNEAPFGAMVYRA